MFFLFVFGGLFVGFVVAHLFPETVMSVAFGVRTDRDGLVESAEDAKDKAGGGAEEADATERPESAEPPDDRGKSTDGPGSSQASIGTPAAGSAPDAAIEPLPPTAPAYAGALARRKPAPPAQGAPSVTGTDSSATAPPASSPRPISPAASIQAGPVPSLAASPASALLEGAAASPPRVVARQKPPLPQGVAAPPADIASFAPADQMEMSQWVMAEAVAGHFDVLALQRGGVPIDAKTPALPGDVFEAQGWAGEGSIGLSLRDVILSMCGKSVGHARVVGTRADVAEKIHPNLGRSGWRARLLAAHLPRCGDGQLRAWAVVPGGGSLLPLGNVFSVALAPASPGATVPPGARAFGPRDVARPRLVAIEILATGTELRRCGRIDCASVGDLFAGSQQGYVAEEAGDWALIVFARLAGWIQKSQFRAGP
ncbi:MAG: hypothetical protein ACKVSF_04135 [Alphaproteobacteria bacterium]